MKRLRHKIMFVFLISFIGLFHEKILTFLDFFYMPLNDDLCKTIPQNLGMSQIKISSICSNFSFIQIINFDFFFFLKEQRLRIDKKNLTFETIKSELSHIPIVQGGKYHPINRITDDVAKIAIIVPYRDRIINLKLFLEYMHQYLSAQNIYYGIYVVEPKAKLKFNRALLMNIGFKEALKEDSWNCFIFHDVDLLPENDQNIYGCDKNFPKQMAISISVYNYM